MNIVVCGACAWIGTDVEVKTKEPAKVAGPLQPIVKANGLVCQCCPQCDSSDLFRKPGRAFGGYDTIPHASQTRPAHAHETIPNAGARTRPEVEARPEEFNENEELDSDIVADLLDEAEAPMVELQVVETLSRPKPVPERAPADEGKSYTCDSCRKPFKSKFETNRCEPCNEAFMKNYVGT